MCQVWGLGTGQLSACNVGDLLGMRVGVGVGHVPVGFAWDVGARQQRPGMCDGAYEIIAQASQGLKVCAGGLVCCCVVCIVGGLSVPALPTRQTGRQCELNFYCVGLCMSGCSLLYYINSQVVQAAPRQVLRGVVSVCQPVSV